LAFRRFGSDGGERSDNSGIGARRLTLQHLRSPHQNVPIQAVGGPQRERRLKGAGPVATQIGFFGISGRVDAGALGQRQLQNG
jgi:hypothetical protein